jgi:hypothetical protein
MELKNYTVNVRLPASRPGVKGVVQKVKIKAENQHRATALAKMQYGEVLGTAVTDFEADRAEVTGRQGSHPRDKVANEAKHYTGLASRLAPDDSNDASRILWDVLRHCWKTGAFQEGLKSLVSKKKS